MFIRIPPAQAARVYDKAALFSDGPAAILNFPPEQYAEDAPKLAGRFTTIYNKHARLRRPQSRALY